MTADPQADARELDLGQVRYYLALVHEDTPGIIEVRALAEGKRARQHWCATPAEALAAIEHEARAGRNVYTGAATRRTPRNGSKQGLQAARAVWVDVDADTSEAWDAYRERLAALPWPPSLRVATGGGEHVYWLLAEPADVTTPEGVARVECIVRGLTDLLGGDRGATDASRILRVPGTINWPDARKRARGRVPALCRIVDDPAHVYTLDDFSEAEARGRRLRGNGADRSEPPPRRGGPIPDDDAALVERANRASNGETFRALWAGDTSGHPSHSEADLALCNLLAFWTAADAERMDRMFRASALYRDKWDERRGDSTYGAQTIARAIADCRETYRGRPDGGAGHASTTPQAETKKPTPSTTPAPDEESATPCSDVANAQRLARAYADELRWVRGLGWLVWTGARWEPSDTDALRRASRLGRIVHAEAAELERRASEAADPAARERLSGVAEALVSWARASESESRIRAAMTLARPYLALSVERLDADPWLLATPGGTVDLRTGRLRPHRRADYMTRLAGAPYDPDARSELWDRVLERALPDPEARAWLQRVAGYTACGATGEDVLVLVHGPTRTAKGTVQGAIAAALGDYAETAGLDDLAERDRSGGARPELARLRGARMVSVYETSARLRVTAPPAKPGASR